jgi:hypothetical protein
LASSGAAFVKSRLNLGDPQVKGRPPVNDPAMHPARDLGLIERVAKEKG